MTDGILLQEIKSDLLLRKYAGKADALFLAWAKVVKGLLIFVVSSSLSYLSRRNSRKRD